MHRMQKYLYWCVYIATLINLKFSQLIIITKFKILWVCCLHVAAYLYLSNYKYYNICSWCSECIGKFSSSVMNVVQIPLNSLELRHIHRCDKKLMSKLFFIVDDGAILDVQFMDFTYPPPDGYDQILLERNLL